MRLLTFDQSGELTLTKELEQESLPRYAILSHTWGHDEDEVTFSDLREGIGPRKPGYTKLRFCGDQARKDGLDYFWVDTCNIDKASHTEFAEAITSMFRWYQNATKCYVYLSDVSLHDGYGRPRERTSESAFRNSRWFRRGWTLQELLAPKVVEFYSREKDFLGTKNSLELQIHEITGIPLEALRGAPLSAFSHSERMNWTTNRETKKKEDRAYCLLGIFNVFIPLIYGEGDNAFKRLNDEINRVSSNTTPAPRNEHWGIKRSSISLFTGREDILRRLESSARGAIGNRSPPSQCRIVVAGIGGQGKSEICLQLAQRVRQMSALPPTVTASSELLTEHRFWGVFWVDVSTPSTAETGFLDIATRLNIATSSWESGRQGLANIEHPWFLVLDNADDPTIDYQIYFPPCSFGVVVLTSRNAECRLYATADFVPLEGLPVDDAKHLLLRAIGVPKEQYQQLNHNAESVATLLQSHPLALIQAGAYIGRRHCTLAEYPKVYEKQRKRLLSFRPSQAQSRYRDVYATFEASVATLLENDADTARDAAELLSLLAVCGPNRLPLRLFESAWRESKKIAAGGAEDEDFRLTQWHVTRLPQFIRRGTDEWDSFPLLEALHTLKAFALVSTDGEDPHVNASLHPLVHAWARDRQDEQQQHESWVKMGCVIAVSYNDYDFWTTQERQLRPHLQAATAWTMQNIFGSKPESVIACILVKAGWIMNNMRDDKNLLDLMSRLCDHLGLDKSIVDPNFLELYQLMGCNFIYTGNVKEAMALLEETVQIQKLRLPTEHDDLLTLQYALAVAYNENTQFKDSIPLLEHIVRTRQTVRSANDMFQLSLQEELATAYQSYGRAQEAVDLLEKVDQIKARTMEADSPMRLRSQHLLARAYSENGQAQDAVNLLQEVSRIHEETMAEDHPYRLMSEIDLGVGYWRLGQHSEAYPRIKHVVEFYRKAGDESHPLLHNAEYWLRHCGYES